MKTRLAGLPLWAWGAAVGAVALSFYFMKRRNRQAATTAGPMGFTSTGPTPVFDNTGGDLTPNPGEDTMTPLPTPGPQPNYLGPPIPSGNGDKGNHQGGGGGSRTGGAASGPTAPGKPGSPPPQRLGTVNALGNARPSITSSGGGAVAAPLPGDWFTAHLATAPDSTSGHGGF